MSVATTEAICMHKETEKQGLILMISANEQKLAIMKEKGPRK